MQNEQLTNKNELFKCQSCPCIFLNQQDLDKHTSVFGAYKHEPQWKRMHFKIEVDPEYDFKPEQSSSTSGMNWIKSKYDSGEICRAEENQQLTHMCIIKGKVRDGLYEYSISQNKQWLKRKPIS